MYECTCEQTAKAAMQPVLRCRPTKTDLVVSSEPEGERHGACASRLALDPSNLQLLLTVLRALWGGGTFGGSSRWDLLFASLELARENRDSWFFPDSFFALNGAFCGWPGRGERLLRAKLFLGRGGSPKSSSIAG